MEAGETKSSITPSRSINPASQAVIDLLAGSIGGVNTVLAGQPLDTVKVKQQAFPKLYPSMVRCFVNTFRTDGIRGLYAGTLPAIAANVAENSVLFCFYGVCQDLVQSVVRAEQKADLKPYQNALAGSCAAIFSSFALCPTELIKCKLQAVRETAQMTKQPPAFTGPMQLIKHIVATEGTRGMFRGLVGTFYREVPGYFFFFYGYEVSRDLLTPKGKTKDDLGLFKTAFCGAIAGVCLWTAIFPTDVVKSRSQLAEGRSLPFFETLMSIYHQEGFRALYNGLTPAVLRTIPATAALFVSYEYSRKLMMNLYPR